MDDVVSQQAREVLEGAWVPEAGYCLPNPTTYPHLWLWDSCFHSLAWMGLGSDRCVAELRAAMEAQAPSGFVPHMRYRAPVKYDRGPMPGASSFTQPPVYGITAERLLAAGFALDQELLDSCMAGVEYLFTQRCTHGGLITIHHPWESGADDSPRWDDWAGASRWNRPDWSEFDQRLLRATTFGADHAANGSTEFSCAPAAFTAITGGAAAALARATGSARMADIAAAIGTALDEQLWNDAEGLWDDLPLVGPGGEAHTWPTLCGVLGALSSTDADRSNRALDQVLDQDRFGGEFGVRYVPSAHHAADMNSYWRGPSWPQMNYLVWYAASLWGRSDVTDAVVAMTERSVVASGFAEMWNPDTGAGLGAIPQSWAAVITAMRPELAPVPQQ